MNETLITKQAIKLAIDSLSAMLSGKDVSVIAGNVVYLLETIASWMPEDEYIDLLGRIDAAIENRVMGGLW